MGIEEGSFSADGEEYDPADDALHLAQTTQRDLRKLLAIIGTVASVAALYFAREVLLPITLAVILSFVLSPIVNRLQRWRVPRVAAAILAVIAALGAVAMVGTAIGSQAASLATEAPQYVKTIQEKVQSVQGYAVLRLASVTKALGTNRPDWATRGDNSQLTGRAPPRNSAAARAQAQRQPVPVEVMPAQPTPAELAGRVISPVIGPLETTFIVLVVTIFILIQREDLRDRVIRLFGSSDLHRTTIALDDAGQRLSRYFLSQFAVNTSFGAVIGVGLWLLDVPSPAMFGILAGMLRFVPYIGSFLAALAPMALAAAIAPGWSLVLFVALLFFGVDMITGYVIEPMLYGHSTGLSPVSVIVAAIFWTWLWGPVGLIISTPLTLCFVVLGRHVKAFEFFDVLLGDKPALTPVETFYQRCLANNSDEALAEAERMLGNRPLVDYYDGVIVQSLRLAQQDMRRGTLDRPRAGKLARLMKTVIGDLSLFQSDTVATQQASKAQAARGKVLCVAGRGPFDAALCAMLSQLLTRSGLSVRELSYDQVLRDSIASLEADKLSAIVLIGLNPTNASAPIRHLVRRVRMHAPNTRVLVGLVLDAGEAGDDWKRTIGADEVLTTLAQTREDVLSHLGSVDSEPEPAPSPVKPRGRRSAPRAAPA